ncbi:hypothetical protein DOM22_08845 [Bdellovibrio sp. ZAP7]|uniref:hypothetical protein n=1 Tax=Bdellovibrio sp. ZAP7 TaxID=2231053 RepID=UPI00115A4057|nr:hypothetical protein [Bdellovibrio sp. ZAP7]QDK45253.1 hypothetical protein DOM22_08845 [Bdellovibrio sp. ZAP7]
MPFDEAGDISIELKNFIRRHIHSIAILDVLFFLKHREYKAWTPQEVSVEMRSNPGYAKSQLEELLNLGIVSCEGAAYRYQVSDSDTTIDKLEILYNTRRSTVMNYIYSQPIDNIRDFANAFKIKKD